MLFKKSVAALLVFTAFQWTTLANNETLNSESDSLMQGMPNACHYDQLQKAAWGMSVSGRERFLSDATLSGNQSVSDGEIFERLHKSISAQYGGEQGRNGSATSVAKKIQWAAECTGNDFTMLAAIIKGESGYCQFLHNKGGGDSGCGQFTSASINFFKNQLRVSGRIENGHPRVKQSIEDLMVRCAPGSSYVQEDSLAKLFDQSKDKIREDLRTAKNLSLDILATAIYLKFYYSVSGFYYDASSPSPGALTRYNGGGVENYGKKAYNKAINIKGNECIRSEDYLNLMQETACALGDDMASCRMDVKTIEI